ncbi:hypothetical protein DFH27DRAFT_494874, partial [Peziza echinospora]
MSSPPSQQTITPAQLFSLAIYNPSLGATDRTVNDQILFYTARTPQTPNEKLRQIGLAQGVVEFSRGFTRSENLSNIETEKSRIVITEVEEGWWALAYIDNTRITSGEPEHTEYSSREVSQPQLLIAQITSAYQQYRFHYGTFSENIKTLGREEFCRRMDRYWLRWAWKWDVILSGNPAIDVWNGTKIAQPRLGATVREVLGAIVAQEQAVEGGGFVDMVVGRYGKVEESEQPKDGSLSAQLEPPRASSGLGFLWPASTESESSSRNHSPARPPSLIPSPSPRLADRGPKDLTAQDGCIFLGTGKLHPQSVRDISVWASNLYRFGNDGANRLHKKKKGKRPRNQRFPSSPNLYSHASGASSAEPSPLVERGRPGSADASPVIPESAPSPAVRQRPQSLIAAHRTPLEIRERSTSVASQSRRATTTTTPAPTPASGTPTSNGKFLSILTFGWAGSSPTRGKDQVAQTPVITEANVERRSQPGSPRISVTERRGVPRNQDGPRFLYGYTGNLDEDDGDEADSGLQIEGLDSSAAGGKITHRSVWLYEMEQSGGNRGDATSAVDGVDSTKGKEVSPTDGKVPNQSNLKLKEYRMVVYINKPFIFILIFRPNTPRLLTPTLYRSLHLRLNPLRTSLVPSKAPTPAKTRPRAATNSKPIVYDLLYDPQTLIISSSIPNIPSFPHLAPSSQDPSSSSSAPLPAPWARLDAVHVHNQVLNIYSDVDREKERKSRTNRGWWLAWNRLGRNGKEAILVW